jgi:hypothetical protein
VDSTAKTALDKGIKATSNLKDKPAASTAKETARKETDKVEAPKMDSTTIEKKAQDLEAEIEKKKKEINDRLKKAKAW